MKIINKDITTIDRGVILHQVNCQGAMNSGVAKAIREKWPTVYERYTNYFEDCKFAGSWCWDSSEMLGKLQFVQVAEELFIGNVFAQNRYGYDKKRYTSYGAWEKAIPEIVKFFNGQEYIYPIYAPYMIGCDRGGGNWNVVSTIIEEYVPDIIYCKYP